MGLPPETIEHYPIPKPIVRKARPEDSRGITELLTTVYKKKQRLTKIELSQQLDKKKLQLFMI